MIFPVFDDVFTLKILGMWEKRGYTPHPPCRGAPPLLSQYHNGLFHKKKQTEWEVRGVEEILF